MQTRNACKGGALVNEAAPFIAEYSARKRLAKLGFSTPLGELDSFRAEVLCIIDAEVENVQSEEAGKKRGR